MFTQAQKIKARNAELLAKSMEGKASIEELKELRAHLEGMRQFHKKVYKDQFPDDIKKIESTLEKINRQLTQQAA